MFNFKKASKAIFFLGCLASLSSCATNYKQEELKRLSYPIFNNCSKELLKSDDPFMCLTNQNKNDIIQVDIKFRYDSYKLTQYDKNILDELYAYIVLSGTTKFTVNGYSGKVESNLLDSKEVQESLSKYSVRLSKYRAEAVKKYLMEKGLANRGVKIKVNGLGYEAPIATNDTKANRALNQRVEISIEDKTISQLKSIRKHLKNVKIDNYKSFFSNVYLLNNDDKKYTAKIYNSRSKSILFSLDDEIFVNHYFNKSNGLKYNIITKPIHVSDNGYNDMKYIKLGSAQYKYNYSDITTMEVKSLNHEAKVGNYVIPENLIKNKLPKKSFMMHKKITAQTIDLKSNKGALLTTYSNLIINKGKSSGLKLGAEIYFYNPATRVNSYPVPPEFLGYGFIYRMSENYSLVLIVNSIREIGKDSMATTRI